MSKVFEGSFYSIGGDLCTVTITAQGSGTVTIGPEDSSFSGNSPVPVIPQLFSEPEESDSSGSSQTTPSLPSGEEEVGEPMSPPVGLYFAEDPVTITTETTDLLDHVIQQKASIRLLCDRYFPEFFGVNALQTQVTITRGNDVVFYGYVEPMAYSQPFNDTLDAMELTCVDALSALQYLPYKDIHTVQQWKTASANTSFRTFGDLLDEALELVIPDCDVEDYEERATASGADWRSLSVNDALLVGDDEDKVWTYLDVINEMMKYLNMHMVLIETTVYIFDRAIQKINSPTTFSTSNVEGTDCRISIGEVFNKVKLKVKLEDEDEPIVSPTDDEHTESVYNYAQVMLREFYGKAKEFNDARKNLRTALSNGTNDDALITDYRINNLRNRFWHFPNNIASGDDSEITEAHDDENGQHEMLWHMRENQCAGLVSIGEEKRTSQANIDQSYVTMTPTLLVSVNGSNSRDSSPLDPNGYNNTTVPTADMIRVSIPRASYVPDRSVMMSPSDSDTTNYLVISGKITMVLGKHSDAHYYHQMSHAYSGATANNADLDIFWNWSARGDNKDHAFGVVRRYYEETASGIAPLDDTLSAGPVIDGRNREQAFKFYYKQNRDVVWKVPMLACMLRVGNKVLVESYASGDILGPLPLSPSGLLITSKQAWKGSTGNYTWQTYKTREQCANDAEYYSQCFFIGINPSQDECIVGKEYDIMNNVQSVLDINASGTAIPIRSSDALAGEIHFDILGPVNLGWMQYENYATPVMPSGCWYNSTDSSNNEWGTNVLGRVDHIELKSLKFQLVSDNGKRIVNKDSELVYVSDTDENFYNIYDNIEMKFTSALTTAECASLGIAQPVSLSTVMYQGQGVTEIFDLDASVIAKAEKLYVDNVYSELHTPHIEMEQTVQAGTAGWFRTYAHPALAGKKFFVLGIDRNLRDNTETLKLRET